MMMSVLFMIGKGGDLSIIYVSILLFVSTPLKIVYAWNLVEYYNELEDEAASLISENGLMYEYFALKPAKRPHE